MLLYACMLRLVGQPTMRIRQLTNTEGAYMAKQADHALC